LPNPHFELAEILYAALNSEHGVCIRTSDRDFVRMKLYALRKELSDESLDNISLIFSPTAEDELWLVKKGASSDAP
jgi:hypothetical protein